MSKGGYTPIMHDGKLIAVGRKLPVSKRAKLLASTSKKALAA